MKRWCARTRPRGETGCDREPSLAPLELRANVSPDSPIEVPSPPRVPSLKEIRALRESLGNRIINTPVLNWRGPEIEAATAPGTDVWLKLELFQVTGTFKPRGALSVILNLDADAMARGVTAVSAGNHAVAVAYAAKLMGTTATVVMPNTANPFRVQRCEAYGAEVILTNSIGEAFDTVERIQVDGGRAVIHPFEGPLTTLGTATLGLEFGEQVSDLDALIIPIGGGGLCAGITCAISQLHPNCVIYGVEPQGANTMTLSFAAGQPQSIDRVETIADSLGAPYALPHSYALCKHYVDEIVLVDDDALKHSMAFLYANAKLAVEPAGAAATAALLGPLKSRLEHNRVGLIVCGGNIDISTLHSYVSAGASR